MKRIVTLCLFVAVACSKPPRPPELVAVDALMKDEANLKEAAAAAREDVEQAKADYARAQEFYESNDIEDSIAYAELADIAFKTAMEKLRARRATRRTAEAKRVLTDSTRRAADAADEKVALDKRITRMEKILALQENLESEKAASRKQKAQLENEIQAAKEAQELALKRENERREISELIAAVRSKLETASVLNASEYAPKQLKGAKDTLALAQRSMVGDQFADARTLIATADKSAMDAIEVARKAYNERAEQLGLLKERDSLLEEATQIVTTSATQERGVVVFLYGMFAPGESAVLAEKTTVLERLAILAKKYEGYPILVEGYTDSQGRAKTNLELSERRAQSVLNYLVSTGKVAPNRARAAGYGESRPVDDNSTAEGRAKNRRVEMVFLFP
ncbi:MAG: OmpA family protein [Myxococcota bacterium]